ncbi:hypothetical protein BY458DRAFT_488095 [Sporodiniella umbellata]|nr:hypothetical protein BY458DRAFT_488095 [Sporodiniella umbellata]
MRFCQHGVVFSDTLTNIVSVQTSVYIEADIRIKIDISRLRFLTKLNPLFIIDKRTAAIRLLKRDVGPILLPNLFQVTKPLKMLSFINHLVTVFYYSQDGVCTFVFHSVTFLRDFDDTQVVTLERILLISYTNYCS